MKSHPLINIKTSELRGDGYKGVDSTRQGETCLIAWPLILSADQGTKPSKDKSVEDRSQRSHELLREYQPPRLHALAVVEHNINYTVLDSESI